ncbi:unnamed protein product [Lampetra planeri]
MRGPGSKRRPLVSSPSEPMTLRLLVRARDGEGEGEGREEEGASLHEFSLEKEDRRGERRREPGQCGFAHRCRDPSEASGGGFARDAGDAAADGDDVDDDDDDDGDDGDDVPGR